MIILLPVSLSMIFGLLVIAAIINYILVCVDDMPLFEVDSPAQPAKFSLLRVVSYVGVLIILFLILYYCS